MDHIMQDDSSEWMGKPKQLFVPLCLFVFQLIGTPTPLVQGNIFSNLQDVSYFKSDESFCN